MPYTTDMMGIGSYVGEIREGPDGRLYEWAQGVDGLGNPIGFWKKLKQAAMKGVRQAVSKADLLPVFGPIIAKVKGVAKKFCNVLPRLEPCIHNFPEAEQPYEIGTKVCSILKEVGIAGADGLMEAPDGQLYEVIEGIGAYGARRKFLRPVPVDIIIPARIRRRVHRPLRPGLRARAVRPPVLLPMVAPQPSLTPPAVQTAIPVARPAPFRRFR